MSKEVFIQDLWMVGENKIFLPEIENLLGEFEHMINTYSNDILSMDNSFPLFNVKDDINAIFKKLENIS